MPLSPSLLSTATIRNHRAPCSMTGLPHVFCSYQCASVPLLCLRAECPASHTCNPTDLPPHPPSTTLHPQIITFSKLNGVAVLYPDRVTSTTTTSSKFTAIMLQPIPVFKPWLTGIGGASGYLYPLKKMTAPPSPLPGPWVWY